MIAASSSEAFRKITRLDTESRDRIARSLEGTAGNSTQCRATSCMPGR